jgi:flagellar hook-associated protein 3 FlgL
MRVTEAMMGSLLNSDLQTIQTQLLQTQQQMASGHRILLPSDDPVGTENVLQWQNALDQNTQYQNNAKDATSWLQSTQSALQQALAAGQQVRNLAVSTGAGDLTSAEYQTIAQQITSLQSSLLEVANTKVGDHYLFSGHQTASQPFTLSGGSVSYVGGSGAIMREVGPGVSIQANVDGNAALTPVFQAVSAVLYDLGPSGNPANIAANSTLSGTNPYNPGPSGDLAQLDSALQTLTSSLGQAGAQAQQAQTAQNQLSDLGTTLQQLQGGVLNDDLTASVVRLQQLQVNYQSALAVGSRLMQPTLADYLH